MKHSYVVFIIILAALFGSGCSNTRKLPAGESLYIGSSVVIKDRTTDRKQRKVLQTDLGKAVRPRPNTTLLGMRLKLTIYNYIGFGKTKGFWFGIRNKFGEPPVLASTVDMELNNKMLRNILENRGFFYSDITGRLDTRRKRTRAKFDVETGRQYIINETIFEHDTSSTIQEDIYALREETLLKPGAPYNLDIIKGERDRIDRKLKEIGYYYFKSDYLIVDVDSTIGDYKVNMYVRLKSDNDIPAEVYNFYNIDNVYIYPNYTLTGDDVDTNKNNAVSHLGYKVIDTRKTFKPSVFAYTMQFEPGDEYNRTDQNATLNRLISLNTFKFVKNRFEPLNDSMMDVHYYLTPYPKKSIRFELGGMTQSDSRVGTQGSISWRHRNTFRGAEELAIKINAGYEAQGGAGRNASANSEATSGARGRRRPDIYESGIETNLSFPRFLVPFFNFNTRGSFMPRTYIRAGFNFESQSNLLSILSYKLSYGYNWKEDARREHQLYPIAFTYVQTDTLSRENLNLYYGNLIFNGIILGSTYQYNYTSNVGPPRLHNFYFSGLLDFAGNLLGTAQGAHYETNPQTLFGASYAQYMKSQIDFRYYLRVSEHPSDVTRNTMWANRLIIGLGMPYGNSYQMPNVKQFFSGGNSSLRGFRSRLVGPGTFRDTTGNIIQTLGDLKLEFNTELRFNIWSFVNGAVFTDAGNIWLYRDNPQLPGGKFSGQFMNELAVDAGIGLRLDFKIMVLRFDVAVPIHKPWLVAGQRWAKNFDFGNPIWRGDNMVFNLAIGYPF